VKKKQTGLFVVFGLIIVAILALQVLFVDYIPTHEEIQGMMLSLGLYGIFAYLFWGTIAVFIVPLNFSLIAIAGGFVYGTFAAFLINWFCKVVGNSVAFWIGQKYGQKILKKYFKKKTVQKYNEMVNSEGIILFFFALCFVPFTPSDTIAYFLGSSKMKYRTFLFVVLLGNIGTSFVLAYIGSGTAFTNPLFFGFLVVFFVLGGYFIHHNRKRLRLGTFQG